MQTDSQKHEVSLVDNNFKNFFVDTIYIRTENKLSFLLNKNINKLFKGKINLIV